MEFYHQFPTSTILVEVHRFMVEIDYYKNVSKQVSTNETPKTGKRKKKKKLRNSTVVLEQFKR